MRQKIVAGNWKMNTTAETASQLAQAVSAKLFNAPVSDVSVILFPPFPYLERAYAYAQGVANLHIGAQDCSAHGAGAYTGEVSAAMLSSLGVSYVLVGHSERRHYFAETSPLLVKKIDAALAHGLYPIYCCGEPLAVRDAGDEASFVSEQIREGLFHLTEEALKKITIAYEPVWAIGTGKSASASQVQTMHAAIRDTLSAKAGASGADGISLLYGGSVNAANAKEIFACADVDGGLVGGAALKAEEFVDIVRSI